MDSNQDVDTRIAQLEQELAEFRTQRPKATRVAPPQPLPRRRLSAWWLAASLVAASIPVATWLHGESRAELATKLQSNARHAEARLSLAERRHDVARRFLDVAVDPNSSGADRQRSLRYLAEELGPKSTLRAWARKELARTESTPGECSKRKAKAMRALEQQQRDAGHSCG